jgi:hypothetical protein
LAKDKGGSAWAGAFQNWYCYQDSSWAYCNPSRARVRKARVRKGPLLLALPSSCLRRNNGGTEGNQDCLSMYGDGTWNDLDCGLRTQAYVVEYGDNAI